MLVPYKDLMANWDFAVTLFDSASKAAVVIVKFKLSYC